MDFQTYLLPAMLGLGLAASSGLNTFLPLLMLATAAHFHVFGVHLNGGFSWLGHDSALIALGIGALIEVVGDKIPVVDHVLDTVGTLSRPAAGALAASSVLHGDPTNAAILGLIIGAPTAFGFHAAKSTVRAGSSLGTLGLANPILSTLEDIAAVALSALSLLFPILAPIAVFALAFIAWKVFRIARDKIKAVSTRLAART